MFPPVDDHTGRAAEATDPPWRIGETVPWVVAWSGEQDFDLRPSASFPGRIEIVQAERPGTGVPLLNGMHIGRQRLGLVRHLCHVCGAFTPRGDRYLFPQSTGTFVASKSGEQRYVNHVPPVHAACVARARAMCPHLIQSAPRMVRFPSDEGKLKCETNAPPGMAAVAEALPAGTPVIYSYFRVHTPAFTRLVQRLRNEPAAASPEERYPA